jgi:hypothetical protein
VVPVSGGNYHVFVQNPVSLFKPGWNEELIRWVFCSSTTSFCGPSAVSYTLYLGVEIWRKLVSITVVAVVVTHPRSGQERASHDRVRDNDRTSPDAVVGDAVDLVPIDS